MSSTPNRETASWSPVSTRRCRTRARRAARADGAPLDWHALRRRARAHDAASDVPATLATVYRVDIEARRRRADRRTESPGPRVSFTSTASPRRFAARRARRRERGRHRHARRREPYADGPFPLKVPAGVTVRAADRTATRAVVIDGGGRRRRRPRGRRSARRPHRDRRGTRLHVHSADGVTARNADAVMIRELRRRSDRDLGRRRSSRRRPTSSRAATSCSMA